MKSKPSDYFKNLYFDAISYSPEALASLISLVGYDRIVFGTDNPFFPPHCEDVTSSIWPSTEKVFSCINSVNDPVVIEGILRGNASRLLKI